MVRKLGTRKEIFKKGYLVFSLLISLLLAFPQVTSASDTEKAISVLRDAKYRTDLLEDYTLILKKQERIDGVLNPVDVIFVKWKRPFSIYLKFLEGNDKGREVIFIEGKYRDKMIVSPGGILGALTIKIAPDSIIAKKNNRHKITEAGMSNTIGRILSVIEDESEKPSSDASVVFFEEEKYDNDVCIHIRINKSSYAARTEVYLYSDTLYPHTIISYDEDGELLESYNYSEIKTNVGLDDEDFDPDNKEYNF